MQVCNTCMSTQLTYVLNFFFADIVELGVVSSLKCYLIPTDLSNIKRQPFTDPFADGPTIQNANTVR